MVFDRRLPALPHQARNINAGPMVMHINNNDGGYLFVLIKEKNVSKLVFCTDQLPGSP
jgi:hypothetical protein